MRIKRQKKEATPPLRGYDLAVEVLAQIEVSESDRSLPQWDQGTWARAMVDQMEFAEGLQRPVIDPLTNLPIGPGCGTAFCFAGWADTLGGEKLDWRRQRGDDTSELLAFAVVGGAAATALELLELTPPERRLRFGEWQFDINDPTAPFWSPGDDEPLLFGAGNELEDLYANVAGLYEKPEVVVRGDVLKRIPKVQGRWARLRRRISQ